MLLLLPILCVCIYIKKILSKLKTLFTCKSKHFLLVIAIILTVLLRTGKNLQGFEYSVKL